MERKVERGGCEKKGENRERARPKTEEEQRREGELVCGGLAGSLGEEAEQVGAQLVSLEGSIFRYVC